MIDNNLPVGQNTTSYEYEGVGNLSMISLANGVKTNYNYNQVNYLVSLTSSKGATPLADIEGSNVKGEREQLEYLTPDHLGTPRLTTDSQGAVIKRRDVYPFGEEIGLDINDRRNTSGYSETDNIRQRFMGYERDEETGLDFAQARYYHSQTGRFISVDPLMSSASMANPQT